MQLPGEMRFQSPSFNMLASRQSSRTMYPYICLGDKLLPGLIERGIIGGDYFLTSP